jgi:hypothetical protein
LPAYRQTRAGVVVPFLDRVAALTGRQPSRGALVVRPPRVQQVALWAVWLCMVTALARPQWLEPPVTKTVPTRDLLLAVDLSGSMETRDFTDASGAQWLDVRRGGAGTATLRDDLLASHGDDELQRQVTALEDVMLHRATRWDGARLGAALRRVRRDDRPVRAAGAPALPALNPR